MKNYQNDVLGQMTRVGSRIEFDNPFEIEFKAETWNKFKFEDYVFNDTISVIYIDSKDPKILRRIF